jgi:hypothetical protein
MKTKKHEQLFLVLVPHPDVRAALGKYSADMINAGFKGGCLFPRLAPLAALSQPFTKDELKQCARAIREIIVSAKNGENKIFTKETAATAFPADECKTGESKTFLFGPQLDLVIPQNLFCESSVKKLTKIYSTPVIGAFLTNAGEVDTSFSPPQGLSFRTAAVANMYYQQINMEIKKARGFKWKIGELIWLPKNLTKQ